MPEPKGTSHKSVTAFNAGEWSPFLDARVDSAKYDSACREITNCTILPYGGLERRGGMKYIANTKANAKSRLIGYDFSTTTSYVIEIGEGYMRFFSNGAPVINTTVDDVLTSGTPPWLEADLFEVQFVQVNDIMYMTHPNHPVQKLSRTGANTFTIEEVVFDKPPFLDVNITSTTITPSVTTGSGTLTASSGIFTADHVGSYWQISQPREAVEESIGLTSTGTSADLTVVDTWNFRTTGRWSGNVKVQELNTSTGLFEDVRSFSSNDGDRNVDVEDDQPTESTFRIDFVAVGLPPASVTAPQAYLEVLNTSRSGVVQITGFNSATSVNMTVIESLESTDATDNWNEGAWSAEQGYPRAVAIFEQRIVYGGTNKRPQTVWGSQIDDFENFTTGTDDDDSFSYTLAASEQNSIQWMSGQTKLLIGTIGAEWTMGGDAEKALTPSNVAVFRQSANGSEFIQGFMVSDTVLYVQRNGRKVRELVESETSVTAKYVSPDMTLFAEHVTDGGIIQADFTQQPNSIFWAVTGEGKLVGMTYERDQDVIGWFKHETDGIIESVATIYGGLNDQIWVTVKRTIDGNTVRFVEQFNTSVVYGFSTASAVNSQLSDKEESFYVDAGITYDGVATATVTAAHLPNTTVQILADGDYLGDVTTDASGIATLPDSLTGEKIHLGLGYNSVITPMKLEADARIGSSIDTTKKLREIVVSFHNSLGIEWATNYEGNTDSVEFFKFPFRDTGDAMDSSPPLFTGTKDIPVLSRHAREGDITIRQTQPLPMTILRLTYKFEVTGR